MYQHVFENTDINMVILENIDIVKDILENIVSVHCREEGCIGKYTPRGPTLQKTI